MPSLIGWPLTVSLSISQRLTSYGSATCKGGHSQAVDSLFPRITFSTCVRDLGVMLDPELTFSHHINLVASFGWFPVLLLTESTLTLVHAFVTSRIDAC